MVRKYLAIALTASTLVAGLAATATPAEAQWHRGYGGYGRGYGHRGYGIGPGAIVGGALLGLGVGALLAAPYAAPPPVVYAPPPRVYYPPRYAYAPPVYAYAPPVYAYAPPVYAPAYPPPAYYAPY